MLSRRMPTSCNSTIHSFFRSTPIKGFLADYAAVIAALLDLYECTYDVTLLQTAVRLQATQDDLFLDKQNGGYFSSSDHDPSVVMRLKDGRYQALATAQMCYLDSLWNCELFQIKTGLSRHRTARVSTIWSAFTSCSTKVNTELKLRSVSLLLVRRIFIFIPLSCI